MSALRGALVSGEAVKMKSKDKQVKRVLTKLLTHNVMKLLSAKRSTLLSEAARPVLKQAPNLLPCFAAAESVFFFFLLLMGS